jgi:hypothetical protein
MTVLPWLMILRSAPVAFALLYEYLMRQIAHFSGAFCPPSWKEGWQLQVDGVFSKLQSL